MHESTLLTISLLDHNGIGLHLSPGRIAPIQGFSRDVAQIVDIALQAKAA